MPNLYVYLNRTAERQYKICVFADSLTKANSLRDGILTMYKNPPSKEVYDSETRGIAEFADEPSPYARYCTESKLLPHQMPTGYTLHRILEGEDIYKDNHGRRFSENDTGLYIYGKDGLYIGQFVRSNEQISFLGSADRLPSFFSSPASSTSMPPSTSTREFPLS